MSQTQTRTHGRRSSAMAFHQGQVLAKVASTYPRLFEDGVVMELVQNSIDSDAKNIWVIINLDKRSIVVRDDGIGASVDDFEVALTNIGESIKRKDRLGRYGIGLISPTGKCEKFIFISTTKKDPRDYHQWTFVCDDIIASRENIKIPCARRPDLVFSRILDKGVAWRTEMRIEKFRKDLRVQKLSRESLTRAIQERFSRAMVKNNTVVHVEATWEDGKSDSWQINAQTYRGTPLEKSLDTDKDSGKTEFNLYLSPKTAKGYKGRIVVGESANDFRFEFSNFIRYSAGDMLPEEVVQGLASGIFEGEITNSKVKMNSDRKSFEQNEALLGFCVAIERWFKKEGIHYLEEANTSRREERYQSLGIRSMKVIEEMVLKDPELMKLVQSFRKGTQGSKHGDGDDIIGVQDGPSMSTRSAGVPRAEPGTGKYSYPSDHRPDRTYERHTPFTVRGPKGQVRAVVRGESIGLQFSYEGLEGSHRLWELNTRDGILIFNTRHPSWTQAEDGGDRCLMNLQEQIAVHALHLEAYPEEWREQAQMYLETALPSLIFLLLNADKIAGRKTIVQQLLPKKK